MWRRAPWQRRVAGAAAVGAACRRVGRRPIERDDDAGVGCCCCCCCCSDRVATCGTDARCGVVAEYCRGSCENDAATMACADGAAAVGRQRLPRLPQREQRLRLAAVAFDERGAWRPAWISIAAVAVDCDGVGVVDSCCLAFDFWATTRTTTTTRARDC